MLTPRYVETNQCKKFLFGSFYGPFFSLISYALLFKASPLCKFPQVMMKIISGSHKVNISVGPFKVCEKITLISRAVFFGEGGNSSDAQKETFWWEIKYAPLFIMDIMDAP